jgi:hypothetical protein
MEAHRSNSFMGRQKGKNTFAFFVRAYSISVNERE